jgi:histidine ammonia-lyase
MGATAAVKLRQVADNLADILALELLCAAQAVDLRLKRYGEDRQLGHGTRDVYRKIRETVPFIERDEYMKPHIDRVREIVDEYCS